MVTQPQPPIRYCDIEGVSRHELQRATCAVLATAFAQVLTVQEMIEKLQASG